MYVDMQGNVELTRSEFYRVRAALVDIESWSVDRLEFMISWKKIQNIIWIMFGLVWWYFAFLSCLFAAVSVEQDLQAMIWGTLIVLYVMAFAVWVRKAQDLGDQITVMKRYLIYKKNGIDADLAEVLRICD